MQEKISIFAIVVCLMFSIRIHAQDNVGTVVKKQGNAELLSNPGQKISGAPPHVLYEGLYYSVKPLKLGTKIENGNILRTGKDGKVKIVFKNGDQFNVGEGTSYKINWSSTEGPTASSTISLIHGTLRGIVNKNGPRSGMKVKTNSAVMGIRGTDFHIGQQGSSGPSSVTVLRGNVEVAQANKPNEVLKVEQGKTAEISSRAANSAKDKAASVINLAKTTKTDLAEIHEASKIEAKTEAIPVEVKQELAKLEAKAADNTLSDIKEYDPKLYEKLKESKVTDVDEINKVVVAGIYQNAPEKKVKVDIKNIDFDDDLYKKYFKIED